MASATDALRGLSNRGIPDVTLKDVSVANQSIPHLKAGTPEGDALLIGTLPNGQTFQGPAWRFEQEKLQLEYLVGWERMLGTLGDIESGPGGALGYWLGDAQGAATGASLVDPFLNNLDPRHPLNEPGVHNAPGNPFIHGAPTHLSAPPSEVEPAHVGAAVAGPTRDPREDKGTRGNDVTEEQKPASEARAADAVRGLQDRLGGTTRGAQSVARTASKGGSSPNLVSRQRRPATPVDPRLNRGNSGSTDGPLPVLPLDPGPSRRYRSIEGPLPVLPSETEALTHGGTTRMAPRSPARIPAMKAPPNRAVRRNPSKPAVGNTDRPRSKALPGAGTTGRTIRGKGLDHRGPPSPSVPMREPLVAAKVSGKGKGQYWPEGTGAFDKAAGSASSPPNNSYVILPKSMAEDLRFRRAGIPANSQIEPRFVNGEQAESYGAGRVFAGPNPSPRGKSRQPAHNVKARAELRKSQRDETYAKTVGAELKQNAGYNELLTRGEKGLMRPGNISTRGVDAITAEVHGDNATIFLNDFTSPDKRKPKKDDWKNWRKELAETMKTMKFDDARVQRAIENAYKKNEVVVRTVRVELPSSATSKGEIRPSLSYEVPDQ